MATVVQIPGQPAPRLDPLAELFIASFMEARRRKQEELEAAQEFERRKELTRFQSELQSKLAETEFQNQLRLKKEDLAEEREKELLKSLALQNLGKQVRDLARTDRQRFIGDVLTIPGLPQNVAVSIIQQSKALFPDPSDPVSMRPVTLFDPQGRERTVNVPESVVDVQAFLEENAPAVLEGGFSTTKPRLSSERETETQRDINSIIETTPALREGNMSDKERRDRARQILRNEGEILEQLEKDLKRQIDENVFAFGSERDRLVFEIARKNIREIMATESDPGKVIDLAKKRGEQGIRNLEFLPEDLQQGIFTQEGLNRNPSLVIQDLGEAVQTIMDSDIIDPLASREERFNEAIKMLSRRVLLDDAAIEQLRRIILGTGATGG